MVSLVSALSDAGLIFFVNEPYGCALELQHDDLSQSCVEFIVVGHSQGSTQTKRLEESLRKS